MSDQKTLQTLQKRIRRAAEAASTLLSRRAEVPETVEEAAQELYGVADTLHQSLYGEGLISSFLIPQMDWPQDRTDTGRRPFDTAKAYALRSVLALLAESLLEEEAPADTRLLAAVVNLQEAMQASLYEYHKRHNQAVDRTALLRELNGMLEEEGLVDDERPSPSTSSAEVQPLVAANDPRTPLKKTRSLHLQSAAKAPKDAFSVLMAAGNRPATPSPSQKAKRPATPLNPQKAKKRKTAGLGRV